ncbi:ribosomal protein L11 methyltransferase [Desulfolithobacter dissulfuricans]|uniref:Ribosomal protein L11 methyltransferase n=1 Tax=Desulfolithobacter dissulfuricans TaxID=2795293 RepID=A0A915XLY4_9BACT|nr:50S ribosomal protein L11 methyltransferase [Desulfolithobacter dissulfuricans]BCO10736.1 ribosomal protein L11 methyltransferase [Desulfolithobacter dissulfuricans]
MEQNETSTVKRWLKLSLASPPAMVESISDLMGVLSGAGVEISADSEPQRITGFFPLRDDTPAEREAIVSRVGEALSELFSLYDRELPPIQVETMDNEDWATSWQQFYTPFAIIPGLVIRPSWEEYRPAKGEKVIELDPGQAFGTGQHASTRMALALTRECCQPAPPGRVLDVGTGTGILAMAAALFGASEVIGIDNDPQAVRVARENVGRNLLQGRISIEDTPLEEIQGPFELIQANIVHDVLVAMAPALRRLLAPSGHIVLAGILAGRQEENIVRVYEDLGLAHLRTLHDDEWAACTFRLEK